MGNATKKIKIGFLNPYLPILGGGERYILSIAKYFLSKSYSDNIVADIDLFWTNSSLLDQIRNKLNIDLNGVNVIPIKQNLFDKFLFTQKYDLLFYVTDGSLFFSGAKRNILIIQSPAHIPSNTSFVSKIKLSRWSTILCYSYYVQRFIEKRLKHESIILAPTVRLEDFKPKKKENIILSVGRFFSHLHSKKHAFLVDSFIDLYKKGIARNWKLVLIGMQEKNTDINYLKSLREKSSSYPIIILIDAPFSTVQDYYARAKIFWLATGFGEDLRLYPERAEHFGIVIVEAMAAQAVPIVFAEGGPLEIIDHGINGWLFQSNDDLLSYTTRIIKDEDSYQRLIKQASMKSNQYNQKQFFRRLDELFKL